MWRMTISTLNDKILNFSTGHYGNHSTGTVVELTADQRSIGHYPYKPKLPLPRECINRIDAGFQINGYIYLISNTFVWQFSAEDRSRVGYPRRLSDVFAGWNYITRAALVGMIILKLDVMFYS